MKPTRRVWSVTLLAALLLAAGCSTLPTSGEVTTVPGEAATGLEQVPDFVPPGPSAGDDREAIVRGFLLAAQANPASTAVARSFLTESARNTWKPSGAIVYSTAALESTPDSLVARLSRVNRIDQRGTWHASATPRNEDLDLDLVLERGEWRIQNPPTALPVPLSYFKNIYEPYLLYFFDRTGTVLVPTRVYFPRGDQVSSSLVRGLLAGPPARQADATRSAFGEGLELDLSVVIGEDGIADIPLTDEFGDLSRADVYRAAVQLCATLSQIGAIVGVRITLDGVAVPLVNGQTDVALEVAAEFDPVAGPDRSVVAIVDGRVVRDDGTSNQPIGGPLGVAGFALRSVAESVGSKSVAAVARNGRRAYLAPTAGERDASLVTIAADNATDLLRPSFDRFGNLWLVDAAPQGAVVHVVSGGRDRIIQVPGISGEDLSGFTVSRDATTLVASLRSSSTLLVSTLVRSPLGRPISATPANRVAVPDSDIDSILGVAQESATAVAVLTDSAARGARIFSVEVDGSPGIASGVGLPAVPGEVRAVLAGPDSEHPVLVVLSDGRLLRASVTSGEWVPRLSGVLDASYPQ